MRVAAAVWLARTLRPHPVMSLATMKTESSPRSTPEPATDGELLRRSACGDRGSFSELVVRHRDGVYRYARSLVRSDADAEDVLQQTFISAWKGAGQARVQQSARPWLLTIARHAAYRVGRRRSGQPRMDDVQSLSQLDGDVLGERAGFCTSESPEKLVQALEERAALQHALDALNDDDREVLVLRDVEGMSGPEAAGVLGITLEAEKSRIHRARLRLAAALRGAR